MRAVEFIAEDKIKLSTDPDWYGAEVGNYKAASPVVNISADQLVGFEPDDKMNQPASKANVKKIIAGLEQGDKLPPLLVRKYKDGYQVLDGHHRFWAYKSSGVKSIPVQVVPAKDVEEVDRQDVAEGQEKNHWYDAGVKDATRGARPNPRTYLPTLKDKQAKHPEEVDFYMNGYKSVNQDVAENFADGRNPQDKGDAKRHGINTKASVSSLRKTAKQGGRKGQLAHWLANMKSGRAKAKKK